MKTLKNIFATLTLITIAAVSVHAQTEATATAASSANIITPIAIEKNVDLVFGNIVPSATEGTVVIATNGARSFTAGASAFANATGDPTAAGFTVTGETGATFSIVIGNETITLANGDGINMTVDNITTNPAGPGTLTGGTQTINVGATLTVGAGQAAGLYENNNDLSITVAYN